MQGDQSFFEPWRQDLEARRDAIYEGLGAMEGVSCSKPLGTFYILADIRDLLGRTTPDGEPVNDAVAMCKYLLDGARVAGVPGDPFGAPGFVRFSFACAMDVVREGLTRIGDALAALR